MLKSHRYVIKGATKVLLAGYLSVCVCLFVMCHKEITRKFIPYLQNTQMCRIVLIQQEHTHERIFLN
jgi:hypothetical protein